MWQSMAREPPLADAVRLRQPRTDGGTLRMGQPLRFLPLGGVLPDLVCMRMLQTQYRASLSLIARRGGQTVPPLALRRDPTSSARPMAPPTLQRRNSSVDESDVSFEEPAAAAKPPGAAGPPSAAAAQHHTAAARSPHPDPGPVKAAAQPLTQNQVLLNFGLVGVSCTIAQFSVHWTQTTMVRQQLSALSGAEPGFAECLRGIYSAEGLSGLYRGFSAAGFREMTYSSLRFGLYEPIKGALGAGGRDSKPWQNVTAGLLAGTIAAGVASPTDLLTARMMKPGDRLGMFETARAVVAESGVRGLYRGIDTTVTRAAILGGTKMGCYDTVKQELRARGWTDGIGLVFAASTITGLATTITTSPATNARTLIMTSPPGTYSSMMDCLASIVRTQGPLGLFRGFAAQWLRFGPYAVVQFTAWEELRALAGMKPL